MLTTAEAAQAIAESMPAYASENVDYAGATGRILRQSVSAERDQPPFELFLKLHFFYFFEPLLILLEVVLFVAVFYLPYKPQ